MATEEVYYNELSYYTLAHPDPAFIHQHIVDAYIAQHADENSKPISLTFALIGLYLYVEKQFTGKQVQRAHMHLANRKRDWPSFGLPEQRGEVTVAQVMAAPAGKERDELIRAWCVSVWEAYRASRDQIIGLVPKHLEKS